MDGNKLIKRLMQVDLNLLVVLHVLLETNSTILTSERIGRTQSAVSLSLKRLRALFDDPLFERDGQRLKPTKLALELYLPIQKLMSDSVSLFDYKVGFDPASSHRHVVFAFPDNASWYFLELQKKARSIAPNMRFELVGVDLVTSDYGDGFVALLAGKIDVLLSFYAAQVPDGLEIIDLPSQHWITLMANKGKKPHKISLKKWLAHEHIKVSSGPSGRNPIGDLLAAKKIERRIGLRTNSFFQALHAVAGSDMLLTTMAPIALPLCEQLGLHWVKAPLDIPPVPMSLIVREQKHDPICGWIAELAKPIFQGG